MILTRGRLQHLREIKGLPQDVTVKLSDRVCVPLSQFSGYTSGLFRHSEIFLVLGEEFLFPQECDCLRRGLGTPGKSALGACALGTRSEVIISSLH